MRFDSLKFVLIFIPIVVWFFYNGILFPQIETFRNNSNNFHYFKDLAISFIHGKTDIVCPEGTGCHDLVKYNQKWYLYWPPAPALAYVPLVILFGRNTPDDIVCGLLGAFNVFLVMYIAAKFACLYKIHCNNMIISMIGIFWGLGTVNLYLSMSSAVWHYSQIIGQSFLLSSIALFFCYLSNRSNTRLIISGILWGLACYSRNDLVFSFFFFPVLYLNQYPDKIIDNSNLKRAILFVTPFFMFSIANSLYNYCRFKNIFENGIKFHQMDRNFKGLFEQHGYFSWHYIRYNFCVEFLSTPPFINRFPFFGYNWEGFGLIWVSPVFLIFLPMVFYFFYSIEKKENTMLETRDLKIMGALLFTLVSIAMLIFSIMGTGWVQFGARYTLDFHIFMLLFISFVFKVIPSSKTLYATLSVLLGASVFINFIGVLYYFNLSSFK